MRRLARRILGTAPAYGAWTRVHGRSGLVFVLGCGRSGTHWLGHILASHPDVAATVEKPALFDLVTRMALDPRTRPALFPELVRRYRREHLAVLPRWYADKSHPNLWLAEDLARAFPRARFVAIQRGPHATVASMLVHKGVLSWHRRWREFPVPNRFLGISVEEAPTYDSLPAAVKCALRWRSHAEETARLEGALPERLLLVRYEALIRETWDQLRRLQQFLGLEQPFPTPPVQADSLDRWRTQLTPEQVSQIDAVVGGTAGAAGAAASTREWP